MGATSLDSKPVAGDMEMIENTIGVDRHDGDASEEQNSGVESIAPMYSAKGSLNYGRSETLACCNIMN